VDRGIDPYEFSSDEYVDILANRILIAVDKYQAVVARSQKTHCEAMEIIKGILSPKYGHDVIMNRVLKVVDEVGREEALLAEAA
jgi:hypothetical protein